MALRESYLQLEQQCIEAEYDLAVQKGRVKQIKAELNTVAENVTTLQAETKRTTLT